MAQQSYQSPYTVGPEVTNAPPAYVLPNNAAFAVPGPEAANVNGWNGDGFSPTLHASPVGVPDANRLRELPLYETRAGEGSPEAFAKQYLNDQNMRDEVTHTDADGWAELKGGSGPRVAPRPKPGDVPESRATMLMSPSTWSFTRPFQQGTPKQPKQTFNGMHFSMADNKREYPIMGMEPPVARRSTFRLEPTPWDTNIVDMPPANVAVYSEAGAIDASDYAGSRSMRLS